MVDPPEALVTHVSQGRIRFKVPSKKHDADFFARLENHFSPLPGIEKVEVNPVTGSVLVLHSLNLTSRQDVVSLAASSELSGLLTLATHERKAAPQRPALPLGRSLAASLATLNDQMKGVTGGLVDAPTLAIVGLLAVGIRQMRQGVVFIPAITALWYATSLLKDQLHDSHAGSDR